MTEFLTMFGSSENGEEHLILCHRVEMQLGAEEHYYISSKMKSLHVEEGENCSGWKDNESNDNSNDLKNWPTLHEVTQNIRFWFACFLIFFGGI